MEVRPSNPSSSRSKTSWARRSAGIFRPLLVIVAGLGLLALALAVPMRISADARTAPASTSAGAAVRPSTADDPTPSRDVDSGPAAAAPAGPSLPQGSLALLLAGPTNGSFEDGGGSLTGWTVSGSASSVEALQSSNFSPAVAPTDGSHFALLCSGPDTRSATAQGNLDGDLSGTDEFDTSFLRQTFTLTSRDVPATLSFDWSFLTSEGTRALDPFDDIFRVRLNGDNLLTGSKPGGQSPFPDVTLTEPGTSVSSSGATNGCSFTQGRTNFATFKTLITDPGTYTLEFLVADQGDTTIDSGLLIDNVRLTPEVDLVITKTASPDPAIPGEPLIYEVTVANNGTGRARDVIVTDTLPSQVEFITDTLPTYVTDTLPSGCTFISGQLFCGLGDIVGGTSRSFEIEVDVDSNALANGTLALVNTAEVDAETPDLNPENDTFILETLLQDSADLRVVKMSKPDTSVRAGGFFTYTIFVDNVGPSHARNVVLTDTILSSGAFTLVSVDDDPNRTDSCTTSATSGGTLVTCSLNQSLEPQGDPPGNGRWTIQMTVRANQAQDVNNEVSAFSLDPDGAAGPQTATPDPDTSNNRATDFISVTATANLGMTKIGQDAGSNPDGNPFTVLAGESITWTINVVNNGPSTAENVAVVDTLPKDLVEGSVSVVAVTSPVGGGQCTVGTPGDPNEPLICQVGNLAPGDSAIITITADIDPSFVANQPNTGFADFLPNDAFLTSDTFDPDTDDNIVFDAIVEVLAQADLGVQKIDFPDPVIAGEQLEYTVVITNAGPSTAEDVTLFDEMPSALTAVEVNVVNEPAATCSIRTTPPTAVDCGFGNILPGKTITLVVTSQVSPSAPAGPITNTVSLGSVTPDPSPATDQESTQIETQADVSITKAGEPVKVPSGEQVKYTLWINNHGPSDAQNVVVYDLLPDQVNYEIDTNSPMCTRPGNLVGLRAVLNGANEIPLVTTEATGLATFVLITDTNQLLFSLNVADIDNITSADISIGPAGAIGPVLMTLFPGPPPTFDPTHPLVGSVTLSPSDAAAILADPAGFYVNIHTNTFPAGEIRGQLAAAVTTQTNKPNTPLRCEIGTLAAGASHHFDVWALVDPATPAGTILTNVGIVTSTTSLGDPDLSNNEAKAKNFVEGKADLHIRKFGKPDGAVRAGEILTYTVVVDNLGPSAATGVAVKDILQTAATFDLVDISSDRETFCVGIPGPSPGITVPATAWPPGAPPGTPLAPGISERLELDCTLTGGLEVLAADGPPNAGRWLLTVRVRGLDHAQNFNNVASVLSEQPDPNLDNNDAFVLHDIIDVADMEINKTELGEVQVDGSPGGTVTLQANQVTAGRNLSYTLTIINNGPSTAENVVIQDRLPPGIVVTGFSATQGDCDTGTPGEPLDKLTCGLGTMAPQAVVTVTVSADVDPSLPAGTILENDALVFSDMFDDNNANDRATNLTMVDAWADLIVTKTDNPDPVVAGEPLEYTVTVTNTGPSDAIDVVVVDVLPQEVTFDHIRDPFSIGVSCSLNPIDEHTLTCALGDMPFGDVKTFTILVQVNPAAPSALDNQVSVSSDTADPNAGDNTFNEGTGVNRAQQLFVVKSDSPDPVIAGTELQYTITFGNNGPSQAANTVVTDTLPLGVIFDRCESLDPNDRVTCTVIAGDGNTTQQVVRVDEILQGNTVVYTNGDLVDVGESFTFKLIAEVESGYVLNGRAGEPGADTPGIRAHRRG
jgi:uncharacterized repeat protein (TIGR01451 family)